MTIDHHDVNAEPQQLSAIRHFGTQSEQLGLGLGAGAAHYRAYVGPPDDYDLVAAMCFGLLTSLGLRGRHRLLDVGCGSLRLGRLLVPYLNEGNYYGLEPNKWLVDDGLSLELGHDILSLKKPTFSYTDSTKLIGKKDFFDFAIAQSIFSHCGPDLLSRHLIEINDALTPGGVLLATFIKGEANTEKEGWIYPQCVEYTPTYISQAAGACGYEFQMLDWLHPRQSWALFAKPGFDRSWFADRPLTWNTWLQHGPK